MPPRRSSKRTGPKRRHLTRAAKPSLADTSLNDEINAVDNSAITPVSPGPEDDLLAAKDVSGSRNHDDELMDAAHNENTASKHPPIDTTVLSYNDDPAINDPTIEPTEISGSGQPTSVTTYETGNAKDSTPLLEMAEVTNNAPPSGIKATVTDTASHPVEAIDTTKSLASDSPVIMDIAIACDTGNAKTPTTLEFTCTEPMSGIEATVIDTVSPVEITTPVSATSIARPITPDADDDIMIIDNLGSVPRAVLERWCSYSFRAPVVIDEDEPSTTVVIKKEDSQIQDLSSIQSILCEGQLDQSALAQRNCGAEQGPSEENMIPASNVDELNDVISDTIIENDVMIERYESPSTINQLFQMRRAHREYLHSTATELAATTLHSGDDDESKNYGPGRPTTSKRTLQNFVSDGLEETNAIEKIVMKMVDELREYKMALEK